MSKTLNKVKNLKKRKKFKIKNQLKKLKYHQVVQLTKNKKILTKNNKSNLKPKPKSYLLMKYWKGQFNNE